MQRMRDKHVTAKAKRKCMDIIWSYFTFFKFSAVLCVFSILHPLSRDHLDILNFRVMNTSLWHRTPVREGVLFSYGTNIRVQTIPIPYSLEKFAQVYTTLVFHFYSYFSIIDFLRPFSPTSYFFPKRIYPMLPCVMCCRILMIITQILPK